LAQRGGSGPAQRRRHTTDGKVGRDCPGGDVGRDVGGELDSVSDSGAADAAAVLVVGDLARDAALQLNSS
jgi:hypothetical protein